MQILVSGEESVLMSIHYDHGEVPEILLSVLKEGRVAAKEITIGKVIIQIFERDEPCLNSDGITNFGSTI